MKHIKLFEALFSKNEIEILTEDAVKMIDLNVLENLTDYFLDDKFWSEKTHQDEECEYQMGSIGVDAWFFNEKNMQLEGNIMNYQNGKIIPWHYLHTKKTANSSVAYRVSIELNDRYKSLPDEVLNKLKTSISRIERIENLKFIALMIRNYNWDKYKAQYLFSKNLDDFKDYDGDVVSFGLLFKKV